MAEKQIAWASGTGYITITYTGDGDGSLSVVSDTNDSYDAREQSIVIRTLSGSPEVSETVIVRQKGKTLAVGTEMAFEYTGAVQEVTLPPGRYKLQCWGAQGGSVTGTYAIAGSKGGYSEGVLVLTEPKTLYIFVGGQGTSYTSSSSQTSTTVLNGGWNGGGAGLRTARYNSGDTDGRSFPRAGGGATDIALVTSSMSYSSGRTNRSSESLLSRFIVAGGGAGASARYTSKTTTSTNDEMVGSVSSHDSSGAASSTTYPYWTCYILNPLISKSGTYSLSWSSTTGGTYGRALYIVHQTSPWTYVTESSISNGGSFNVDLSTYPESTYSHTVFVYAKAGATEPCYLSGAELYVEEETTSTSTSSGKSSAAQQGGGTSGKGTYGGGQSSAGTGGAFGLGATQSSYNYRYCGGGGGGGWYGGGTNKSDSSTSYVNNSGGGSGFVNTAANASYRPSGYTGLELESGTTTEGSSSHPSTSGSTETGHSGNGYAKITVL